MVTLLRRVLSKIIYIFRWKKSKIAVGKVYLIQKAKSVKKNRGRITFVLDFHPALSELGSIINAMWPVLQPSEDMKKIFWRSSMLLLQGV